VSLFADSIDFLEDASINFLIFVAVGWSAAGRARVGMLLAGVLLIPSLATLWMAWEKLNLPVAPDPVPLSLAGAGALTVNLACAVMLTRFRHQRQPHARRVHSRPATPCWQRRHHCDGVVTAYTLSAWPDLIVGLAIAALNAGAAWEVWEAARKEHQMAAA
jgi:Co/Zn/Cd efflux system component